MHRLPRLLFWIAVTTALLAAGIVSLFRVTPQQPAMRVLRVNPLVVTPSALSTRTVRVTIYGNGFGPDTTVQFANIPPLQATIVSDKEIEAHLALDVLQPGWYDVAVQRGTGEEDILREGFAVRNREFTVPKVFYTHGKFSGTVASGVTGAPDEVRGFSVDEDKYPHINVGVYPGSGSMTDADVQFAADHYDTIMAVGTRSGDIRAKNSHVMMFPYIDLTSFNNGNVATGRDGHTDDKIASFVNTYNAANNPDISAEDFYLHARCDCSMLYGTAGHCQTYSASDPQCTQTAGCPYSFITGTKTPYFGWNSSAPGTPNADCIASTALTRKASRMMTAYLPMWDVPNYAHPQMDEYFVDIAKKENIGWNAPGSVHGLMFDTVVKDNGYALADGIQMSHEYWGADVRSTTTPTQAFSDYFTLQNNVQSQLNAVSGQSGFRWPGNVISIPNEYPLSIYTDETIAKVPEFFVETFFDGIKSGANTFQAECGQWKSLIDETVNKGKNTFLNAYERAGTTSCLTGSSDCRTDRGKLESLAMYYLIARPVSATTGTTHYGYVADVTNGSYEQRGWNRSAEIDIGQPATTPSGAKDIFGNTGTSNFYNFTDPTGGFTCPHTSITPTHIIYARKYTNGLVLVKHRHDYGDTVVYGDGSASDTTKSTHTLDDSYHPVNADGTLGAATNSLTLSNSQGAILLKNRAPVLSGLSDSTVLENDTISFEVTVSDPDGDAVALGATGLPSTATYLANGENRATFTWKPTYEQAGSYAITFTASDVSLTASTTITINVTNINRAPSLTMPPKQTMVEGDLLALGFVATDPDGDALTLKTVNLPKGATLTDHGDSTATLRWQPGYDQSGTYTSIRVEASDGKLLASAELSITVTDATAPTPPVTNVAPQFTEFSDQEGTEGDILAFAVGATDLNGDAFTLKAANLPAGATFTDYGDQTGTFRWQPMYEQAGIYPNVKFTASDGKLETTKTITITIKNSVPEETAAPGAGGSFPDSREFTAFPAKNTSGFFVASGDVWGDLRDEIVVSSSANPQVRVYSNDGTLRGQFYAYPKNLAIGVRVAVCDLNGDGRDEIVTVPGPGYIPQVRIFAVNGTRILSMQFWALNGNTKIGASIACGDLDGDGKAEVVIGSSIRGGRVTIHRMTGSRTANFYPHGRPFTGGLRVAVTDANGDGKRDVVVTTETGTPQVVYFTARGKLLRRSVFPYARSFRKGVNVAVGNLDGEFGEEVMFAPERSAQPRVKVYAGDRKVAEFDAYNKTFSGGVRIASGDVDGDGVDEIITVPASRAAAKVRLFTMSGQSL